MQEITSPKVKVTLTLRNGCSPGPRSFTVKPTGFFTVYIVFILQVTADTDL